MRGFQKVVAPGKAVCHSRARSLAINLEAIHFGKANLVSEKRGHLTAEAAELLAIDALGYLANEPEALSRFLALSGIGPAMLRSAAADAGFLVGVLDYFLGDEPLLIAYATHASIPATRVASARRALGGREQG
jgi:hypothetical protein